MLHLSNVTYTEEAKANPRKRNIDNLHTVFLAPYSGWSQFTQIH